MAGDHRMLSQVVSACNTGDQWLLFDFYSAVYFSRPHCFDSIAIDADCEKYFHH
jgi:hypothetical protein